jgi:hypothetical protein
MGGRNWHYQYLLDTRAAIAKHVEDTRKLVKASKEILNSSVVDSFLGRKTQEPFQKEPFSENTKRL